MGRLSEYSRREREIITGMTAEEEAAAERALAEDLRLRQEAAKAESEFERACLDEFDLYDTY